MVGIDVIVTSTDHLKIPFKDINDKTLKWTTGQTIEKKVAMAVMVHLVISHDGAIDKVSIERPKTFSPDIKVDRVRTGQNVPCFNAMVVWKFFNKGFWVSDAGRKEHREEFTNAPDGQQERIPNLMKEENNKREFLIAMALRV